ncbi:hypothetical protein [Ketobacter sp.]|uniref:hypothetical protein n=1 Tax=Ketobacter sp. TaxID=2083498 RepID=UPI000F25CF6D|nr:hypothetical protein [Ketobacter sp.]RLU01881.1 MAG: hypothetical protein D9N14_00845 [Ketobacter sp.]
MTDEDRRLQQALARSLDRSLDELDEHTLQQLQQIRLQAQQPPRRAWRPALAAAASILLLIAIPWSLQQPAAPEQAAALFSDHYLSVDPELLADWDMLEAIGEVPDA